MEQVRVGRCYELAWRYLKDLAKEKGAGTKAFLVHGTVIGGIPTRTIQHAWVEFGEKVYEPQSGDVMNKREFYRVFKAVSLKVYPTEKALVNAVLWKTYGPW